MSNVVERAEEYKGWQYIPFDKLRELEEQEFEVDCDGEKVRLKPLKVWTTATAGSFGSVIAVFKCPNGKKVTKCLGYTYRPLTEFFPFVW